MAESTLPERHRHWCSSQRIGTHRIIKKQTDTHTHTLQTPCVHLMDTPLLVTGTIAKGIVLTERHLTSASKITTSTKLLAHWAASLWWPLQKTLLDKFYGKTSYSVKDWKRLGTRVTSHAEAACRELQVSQCIHLNCVAPLERWGHHVVLRH